MGDVRPSLDVCFASFAVSAVVTVPAGVPVTKSVVMGARAGEHAAASLGAGLALHESLTPIRVRRSDFAALPVGTTIAVGSRTWTVARADMSDSDEEVLVVGAR